MIDLHVMKPHSLTQMAICLEDASAQPSQWCYKPLAMAEELQQSWEEEGTDLEQMEVLHGRTEAYCVKGALAWNEAAGGASDQDSSASWEVAKQLLGLRLDQWRAVSTSVSPAPNCMWMVMHKHITCGDTTSQDPNSSLLKTLQFSCSQCAISNTFEHLQYAIAGNTAGLICNDRLGFTALSIIPSPLFMYSSGGQGMAILQFCINCP